MCPFFFFVVRDKVLLHNKKISERSIFYAISTLDISYHLFSFCRSMQDYKIRMDMEIVTFRNQEARPTQNVQESRGSVQYLRLQYYTNYLV